MKKLFKLLPALLGTFMLTACITATEDDEPYRHARNVRYTYSYLTYCEIYRDGFMDCEDMGSGYVNLYGIFDVGEIFIVDTYLGVNKGTVTDRYYYRGRRRDSKGSYDYFEQTSGEDRLLVYDGDFAVMRAWDDSYYWSYSQWDDLYKKGAK